MLHNIYASIYFIKDLKSLYPFIDSLSVSEICNNYESKIYLKTINWKIRRILTQESNFVRVGIDKKGIYAIFLIPKKFGYFTEIIDKVGMRGVTKEMLLLYNDKTLDTKSTQGFFFVYSQ